MEAICLILKYGSLWCTWREFIFPGQMHRNIQNNLKSLFLPLCVSHILFTCTEMDANNLKSTLVQVRQQIITWTAVGPDLFRYMAWLSYNKLKVDFFLLCVLDYWSIYAWLRPIYVLWSNRVIRKNIFNDTPTLFILWILKITIKHCLFQTNKQQTVLL